MACSWIYTSATSLDAFLMNVIYYLSGFVRFYRTRVVVAVALLV